MLNPEVMAGQNLGIALLTLEVAAHTGEDVPDVDDLELTTVLSTDEGILHDLWASSDQTKVSAVMTLNMVAWVLVEELSELLGRPSNAILADVVRRVRSD
jgi:hypothetical protein